MKSALARPKMAAFFETADPIRQGATLLRGLVENHPFHDGNKRTAWVAMRAFMILNGWAVTGSEDERFTLIVAVAQGLGVDEANTWLRANVISRA